MQSASSSACQLKNTTTTKKPLTLWLWIELENVISCFITTVKIKWLAIKNKAILISKDNISDAKTIFNMPEQLQIRQSNF